MKKIFFLSIMLVVLATVAEAQTTAFVVKKVGDATNVGTESVSVKKITEEVPGITDDGKTVPILISFASKPEIKKFLEDGCFVTFFCTETSENYLLKIYKNPETGKIETLKVTSNEQVATDQYIIILIRKSK